MMSSKDENIQWNVGSLSLFIYLFIYLFILFFLNFFYYRGTYKLSEV